ncbi:hypothetical protein IAR50_003721 [Cryptococcus sp. DSM 104548]
MSITHKSTSTAMTGDRRRRRGHQGIFSSADSAESTARKAQKVHRSKSVDIEAEAFSGASSDDDFVVSGYSSSYSDWGRPNSDSPQVKKARAKKSKALVSDSEGEEETILGTSREDVRMTGESEESDSASVIEMERKADEDALMSLASKQKDARPKSRPSKPASIPIPASPSPQPIDAPPTLTTEKDELALKSSERPLESIIGIPARARSYRFPLHDDTAIWCLRQVEHRAVAASPIHQDLVQDWFQDWLKEAGVHYKDIIRAIIPNNWDWPEIFFTLTETGIRKLAKRQTQSRDLDVRRIGKVCLALSLLLRESPTKPVLISVTHNNIKGTTDEYVDLVEGWETPKDSGNALFVSDSVRLKYCVYPQQNALAPTMAQRYPSGRLGA